MRQLPVLAALCLATLASLPVSRSAAADSGPAVVVSIKPIHALVAGVMDGIGEPHLLVDQASSPHTYSLRPSDARALQDADIVFWVSPALETFLDRPLDNLSGQANVVTLMETEGLNRFAYREGGQWAEHDHGDHGHAGDGHDHDKHGHDDHEHGHDEHGHDDHEHGHDKHGRDEHEHSGKDHDGDHGHAHDAHHDDPMDAHIWLDTNNARRLTAAIAQVLAAADPDHADRYAKNAAALTDRLAELDKELGSRLERLHDRPYIVFHDAYQYFERQYGLKPAGSITVSPDRAPGARHLSEIQDRIAQTGAACLFAEPQFEPRIVTAIAEATGIRTGTLDPLGATEQPGVDAYFGMMRGLADNLVECLRPQS